MTSNEGTFTIVPNSLIDDKNLTITEKGILFSLLRFYNKEQQRAWPSTVTLAEITQLSQRCVISTLMKLETKGYIRTEKKHGCVTRYEILTTENSSVVTTENSSVLNDVQYVTTFSTPLNDVQYTTENSSVVPLNDVQSINTNRQVLNTSTKDKHDTTPAKTAPKNESNFEADFEDFWRAYPKPKNPDKTPGRQKYIALRKKGVSADDLLKAAQNYAQAMRGTDPRYIKHCRTFLGPSDAWCDYLNEPAQASDELPDAAELFPDLAEWMRRNRGVANGE